MPPKRKRRQYGTGSVYQRKSDGLWIGKIQAGWTANGTRRTITVSAKTEAEAKRRLERKRQDIAREGLPPEGARSITVKAWADQWLPQHARDVRPKAYTTDAGAVAHWIIPTLGHRRLEHLRPSDVRALRDAITEPDPPRFPNGRSLTTARQAHWTLMGMLKAARQEGYPVPANVTEAKAPKHVKSDREAIPLDAAVRLLDVASTEPGGSRWVAALLQGMRQGERLGLTREMVDFEAGEIDISWQLQPLPYLDKHDRSKGFRVPDGYEARHLTHSYHLVTPKTGAGQRVIPMVPWLAASLEAWLQVAPENPWGLLWTDLDTRNGGARPTPYRGSKDRAEWEALQARANVRHPSGRPYTMHEARNTTATLLFEAGVDGKVITAILGHSSIVTSRGYQSVSREGLRDAMERVAKRLGR